MEDAFKKFYQHRDNVLNKPAHIIGHPKQKEVILDASNWMGVRGDGQANVRKAYSKKMPKTGGAWKVNAHSAGKYAVSIARWPKESGLDITDGTPPLDPEMSGKPAPEGKALPIDHATLEVNNRRLVAKDGKFSGSIYFEVDLKEGENILHGIFRNKDGYPECGAFYGYISKL